MGTTCKSEKNVVSETGPTAGHSGSNFPTRQTERKEPKDFIKKVQGQSQRSTRLEERQTIKDKILKRVK